MPLSRAEPPCRVLQKGKREFHEGLSHHGRHLALRQYFPHIKSRFVPFSFLPSGGARPAEPGEQPL